MVYLIVAIDRNRAIGKGGKMPWHLPADLKRFKKLTSGHPVIMGRKTYESIGKPLPDRANIVLTRQTGWKAQGCTVAHSLDDALALVKDDVFVIGGEHVYRQAIPLAKKAYVTEVEMVVEDADAHFPELDDRWMIAEEEVREADEKNPYRCIFRTYVRQ